MTALPSTRELCYHEAHHAASLILSRMMPQFVRVDYPGGGLAGSVRPDWDAHGAEPNALRELLLSVLLGPIADGEVAVNAWPIEPGYWTIGSRRDGEQAAFLVDVLGLDEVSYRFVVFKAYKRARDRYFRTLVVAIAAALEERELLLRHELETIACDLLGSIGE